MTLCNPVGCSTPDFPVLLYLLEPAQTHVHRIDDVFQPSRPVSSPSPPAFNLPQHQGLSFPMSQFFTSSGQSIGASTSASVLPMNIQDWFPLGLIGWISLQTKGLSRVFSNTTVPKCQIFGAQLFFIVQLSNPCMIIGKTIGLTIWTFVGKVMSLLFNMLSRLIIAFLPRSKCLLISWLQSSSAVIFGAQENKLCHCFHFFPVYLPWSDGTGCHDLSILNV